MKFKGLNESDVEIRKSQGQVNVFKDPNDLTIQKIIQNNICTFFNLIILVLAILIISAGAYKNLMFIGVAFCNLMIGIIQEIRAKRTLDRLNIIAETKINVIRDSVEKKISMNEIVLDDILHLKSGNQIVVDSVVLDGKIEVNESLLTGEADIIEKKIGDELFSGSFIVSGEAYVKVIHVGKDNLSSQIMLKAKSNKKQKSILQENIDMILKIVSMIILPLGILLFLAQFVVNQLSYSDSILGTVAGVSGMIPEGLVLLTSVSLAVGAIELSKKKTLLHNLYSIETLAHVDVLCLDKTGTLTEGKMRVEKIYQLDDEKDISTLIRKLLTDLNEDNATSLALKDYFGVNEQVSMQCQKIPFSSERKFSGVSYPQQTLLIGAMEYLFPNGEEKIKNIIHEYTTGGMRVIVLAQSNQSMHDYKLPNDLKPIALILISDCIRESAKDTLEYFETQGVDVRIISGDAPETVSLIAQRVGVNHADLCIDASTLTSKKAIEEAVLKYKIFGRVRPKQKKEIVEALQKAGHTVGMTGDGVNDVMALKQADCSIAMAEGSEAAKEVANIVLLDSDFSHLPSVLSEGRKIIHHIQDAASLFLVKTGFSFLITLMTMFTVSQYPFEPIQLTFIGTVAIGIPSLLLTFEKDYTLVEGKFIINVLSKALPGSLSVFIEVVLASLFCEFFQYDHEVRSTICVLSATLCTMLVLKKIYPLRTFYRRVVFFSMSVIAVVSLVFLHDLFEMVILDVPCFIVTLLLFILAFVLSHYFNLFSKDVLEYLDMKLSKK